MIAADSSTWIAFFQGDKGSDTELLDQALKQRQLVMVPVVLTELVSDPKLPTSVAHILSDVPLVGVEPGYWQRAGALRAKLLGGRRRARLGDALVAQCCVDSSLSLITRNRDLRAFADAAGLALAVGPQKTRP